MPNIRHSYRTSVGQCLQAAIGDLRAGLKIDGGEFTAVLAERLYGDVGDLLALGQVQMFNVVAVLS